MPARSKSGDRSGLAEASPHYLGHRDRLRTRFREAGADALSDYEMLELVLFRALPRRDTKGIAKRLLARFGSFAEVVNAPEPRLKEVKDCGDSVVTELKLVRAAALRMMRSELVQRPALSSWKQVLDYLLAAQSYEHREQFRILFLDKRNRLIADEIQQEGTVDHTPVYVREVVKLMGADRVIFGSDWPHIEGMPQPLDYVSELASFGPEERRRILRDNAVELNSPNAETRGGWLGSAARRVRRALGDAP